jgi:hypothetical protein
MSANRTTRRWKDNASIYPDVREIVVALQDPGVMENRKEKGKDVRRYKYPLLDKLAGKIYKNIYTNENKPDGLTKNPTRGKQPLYKEMVLSRKKIDLHETPEFFHEFAKDGKVFLITTDTIHCGLDVCIDRFQDYVESLLQQKNSARSFNDGLRLGCIMLDSQYRESVAGVLSKKKNRSKSDIAGDPNTHFFEHILTESFMNPSYQVRPPAACYYDEFPEEEKEKWNPNDGAIFEHERDGAWLRSTWDEYIKPKYKKALDKWNKSTGGGDGSPTSFINFCGNDRWLVWLFCRDLETNFLLASSAGGRMPSHLQVEAGFTEDVSSIGGGVSDDTGSNSATPAKNKRFIEDELRAAKKHRNQISDTMEKVATFLQAKSQDKKESPKIDRYIRQVASYSQMMVDSSVLDTMTPNSKAVYVDTLKRQRKSVLDKMNKEGNENS